MQRSNGVKFPRDGVFSQHKVNVGSTLWLIRFSKLVQDPWSRKEIAVNKTGLGLFITLLLVACGNVAPKGPSPKPPPTLPIEAMTLEQAQQIAHFHILEPRYIPTGLHLQRVLYYPGTYFVLIYAASDTGGQSPNTGFVDITEAEYHEVPIPPGGSPLGPTPVLPNRPAEEIVTIRGLRANVERFNSPPAWNPAIPASGEYITLSWHTNTIALSLTDPQGYQNSRESQNRWNNT